MNPSDHVQNIYDLLVNAEEFLMSELVHGAKLSDVYNKTVNMIKKEKPELVSLIIIVKQCLCLYDLLFSFKVPNLTKNFGFVMGIEFREGTFSITANCNAVATKGMIFNVNIGFAGIVNKVYYENSNSKFSQLTYLTNGIIGCWRFSWKRYCSFHWRHSFSK